MTTPSDSVVTAPKVGEHVQRVDDLRTGVVEHVARAGEPCTWPIQDYDGDVTVRLGPGRAIVSSGGAFFWSKWKRIPIDEYAKTAIECAARFA